MFKQSIAVALALKLLFVVLAVAGAASLWMAIAAEMDSNAGLSTFGQNFNQDGALDLSPNGEVEQLEDKLEASAKAGLPDGTRRVRAVVVHHSLAGWNGLDPISRKKLLELAETYSIAVILTGHVHEFGKFEWDTEPNRSQKAYELRCASTLQAPHRRVKPAPGLLAHKIYIDDDGQIHWKAWRFEWDPTAFQFGVIPNDQANPFADLVF